MTQYRLNDASLKMPCIIGGAGACGGKVESRKSKWGGETADCGPQTAGRRLQTADRRLQTADQVGGAGRFRFIRCRTALCAVGRGRGIGVHGVSTGPLAQHTA